MLSGLKHQFESVRDIMSGELEEFGEPVVSKDLDDGHGEDDESSKDRGRGKDVGVDSGSGEDGHHKDVLASVSESDLENGRGIINSEARRSTGDPERHEVQIRDKENLRESR